MSRPEENILKAYAIYFTYDVGLNICVQHTNLIQ